MSEDMIGKQGSRHLPVRGGNFWYLFAGLLLTLLAMPFSSDLPGIERYSIALSFCLFMLIAVWSLAASRRVFRFGVLLVLIITGIAGMNIFAGSSRALEPVGLALVLIFCCLSCYIAARNVFVWHRVDLNSIVGAFCVYLLFGMIWALMYRLLNHYGLATFSGNVAGNERELLPDLIYFSFVTLASLGYGDISPIGGLAKTFAYLEAVVGQFYLAVMVATLVGVYSAGRKRE
ncbi:MAG: ion channel [Methylomonas sp.]